VGWLLLLACIAGVAWLWFESMGARETAEGAARDLCAPLRLILLDDTVSLARLRPVRSPLGRWQIRRHYVFDYTDDGLRRLQGFVTLVGRRVESAGLADPRLGAAG
jgi:hypothetical protein